MALLRAAPAHLVALLLVAVHVVRGDYTVSLRISSYSNPSHRHYNGGCCDPGWFSCGHCDNYFVVCVRSDCQHTGEVGNSDTLSFTSSVGDLPNPLTFSVPGPWTGFVKVVVDVYDNDDTFPLTLNGDEFVDQFLLTSPTGLATIPGIYGRGTITLSLTVSCSQDYYGHDCSVYCADITTHTCGPDGSWLCVEGWTGDACDMCVPLRHCSSIGGYCEEPGDCLCRDGFSGPFCDTSIDAPSPESPSITTPSPESPSTTTPSPETPSTNTPSPETPSTSAPSTSASSPGTPSTSASPETPSTSASPETPSTSASPETPSSNTPSPEAPTNPPTNATSTDTIPSSEKPSDVTTGTPTDANMTTGIRTDANTTTATPTNPNTTTGTPTDANMTTGIPTDANTTTGTPTNPNTTTGTPTDANTITGTPTDANTTTGTPTDANTTTGTPADPNMTTGTPGLIAPEARLQSDRGEGTDVGGVVGGVVGGAMLLLLLVTLVLGLVCCLRRQRIVFHSQLAKEKNNTDTNSLVHPLVGENPVYMERCKGSHALQNTKDYHQFQNPLYQAVSPTGPPGGATAARDTASPLYSSPSYAYPSYRGHLLASVYLPGNSSSLNSSVSTSPNPQQAAGRGEGDRDEVSTEDNQQGLHAHYEFSTESGGYEQQLSNVASDDGAIAGTSTTSRQAGRGSAEYACVVHKTRRPAQKAGVQLQNRQSALNTAEQYSSRREVEADRPRSLNTEYFQFPLDSVL